MPSRNYYEIKKNAFLFGKNESPEESVRQWLLFELMITYGYSINQIKIEVPVKYGTVVGRADIVVYKENLPFIVIECKRQEDEKIEKHLAQAQSYAAGLGIKAEYSVYSNGEIWIVERLINDKWEYCVDIPNVKEITQGRDICDLFFIYDVIRLLLYWYYKRIPREKFEDFVMNICHFLNPYSFCNAVTKGTNENLLSGVFGLALSVFLDKDNKVDFKRLYNSYIYFIKYYYDDNIELPPFEYKESFCTDDITNMTFILLHIFEELIFINSKGISNLDVAIIRFIIALLHQVQHQIAQLDKVIEFNDNITIEFFNYLEMALKINFNLDLPDRLDKNKLNQLYSLCEKFI